ncbi:PQQ-like domain-containing protein [Planctomicrobium piriforme]|uniref:PQQ-like domain-containing protein n=2 Tax=Planctomicrobium piriforme TaxID=1576369 RepID=A0A1I3NBM7_9PLAN|nr:PQQ-like domain-containing protein [Planctomicrobium piriforme]
MKADASDEPGRVVLAQKPDGGVVERAGTDWPCFLGPQHDGTSTETGLLESWPKEGPPLLWQKKVGTGYSAPSVLGRRLVLHHRLGNEEIVECMDAVSGETLWKHADVSRFQDPYGYNNGPRCTPLLSSPYCFTLGAGGKLLCLALETGKLVWQLDLQREFKIPEAFFGVGATPILEGNNLIVAVGGQPNSALVAFEAATGKILWQNGGKSTWNGAATGWDSEPKYEWTGDEMVVSYSSPQAATFHGRRHILCLLRQGLLSVDPETGAENFHYWFRSRTHESVNAAQPVVVGDTILLGAAYRVGSACLQVAPSGKEVKELWRDPRALSTHWSTSLFFDGCYFGFSGRHENEGVLQCVDAATGKVKWQSTGWEREADLQTSPSGEVIDAQTGEKIPWPMYGRGSAILADGKFIVLAERGTLALLSARTDKWEEISRYAAPGMKYPSWTAPVLSRGLLYLRCEDALTCLKIARDE